MIPYGRQDVTQADIDAVVAVLRSDFLTQGPAVPRFERAVTEHVGAGYAVAVNSATSALHLACLALGVGPGDRVWTSPISFVASANCARYCGADVDFVDIDARTYNMSPLALEEKLLVAERNGQLPRVVIPVHLCGQPCALREIHALSQRFGFRIIEDASHAIGAHYLGEPVGNCRYSDITVFSFHPVKIITSGEGGMALTNDAALASRMALLRSHGITRDPDLMTGAPAGGWCYEQIELGYNYRLTDIQAALGLSQLQRLEDYVTRRRQIAVGYEALCAALPLVRPWQSPEADSAWHLYVVRIDASRTRRSRAHLYAKLHEFGIGANVHYIPVHLQPYYSALGFRRGDFPSAERYYDEALTLPLYPTIGEQAQQRVIEALRQAL